MTTPTSAAPTLRRVAGLALPALVVLAAEPLYVLVDTAVVGHLGRTPLASVAIGGQVLTVAAWLGTVLAYGTTGRSARRYGAGDRAGAVAEGVQASWLALAAGLLIAVGAQVFADPLARTLAGNNPDVAAAAAHWLRVAALGAPGLLLATAGNGWMRGVQDTRRPMYYVLGANLLSAAACPTLVYGLHLGLIGSAIANAGAQTLSGALFVRALVAERVSLRPHPAVLRRQLVLGRDLLLRGAAFQASFLSAAAVAARFGAAALAAHQIALQLWFFCALVLDAVAIAAQSLVGAALGAGEDEQAKALARRITVIGLVSGAVFAAVIGAGAGVLPKLFTSDPQVFAQAMRAWPWFAGMLPLAGVVFALDGVLIGAGDVRYMRNLTVVATLGGFLPAIWLAYWLHLGLAGVWAGLTLFIVIRLVGLLARMRSGRWAVVGATR
ncbi:MATE family efflux transporter [Planosporangium mesophilum]|uniref:Putative DNA-damage-inducible protein F n=1 Tax=Planosporangium mesophilum TaxID=689768 RepID=A0A8J3T756_9ACTN|nr:MATE family efflux transporter [Planosporangium mesophilum]NJC81741.1 MATE family efflux transporter [Planosporangium mesophilum]GII20597.1 putative DNA-damage-inducible protein F [Planosporangium mesophilum]